MVLQKLLTESDRLIVSQITAPHIKSTRIKHLDGHRAAIEALNEPHRTHGLTHLDCVISLAHAINDGDGYVAERMAAEIRANLDAIDGAVT